MWIVMETSVVDDSFSTLDAGKSYDIDEAKARQLVALGQARPMFPPKQQSKSRSAAD